MVCLFNDSSLWRFIPVQFHSFLHSFTHPFLGGIFLLLGYDYFNRYIVQLFQLGETSGRCQRRIPLFGASFKLFPPLFRGNRQEAASPLWEEGGGHISTVKASPKKDSDALWWPLLALCGGPCVIRCDPFIPPCGNPCTCDYYFSVHCEEEAEAPGYSYCAGFLVNKHTSSGEERCHTVKIIPG
jgi:hypothetical protein